MNEVIKKELQKFILNLENADEIIKKRYHYGSVINLSNGILLYSDGVTASLKQNIIEYFEVVNSLNYLLIGKVKSMELYRKHLQKTGNYLIKNSNFSTRFDFITYSFTGIIFDIIFYYSAGYLFIVFTPIMTIAGFIRRRVRMKKNKYFSHYW